MSDDGDDGGGGGDISGDGGGDVLKILFVQWLGLRLVGMQSAIHQDVSE